MTGNVRDEQHNIEFCHINGNEPVTLASITTNLGQVEQSAQHVLDGAHVLVFQPVGGLQVVRGEVLAAEASVGRVLSLPCRVYGGGGVEKHRVVGFEGRKAIVNLLCHAVVVLALASGKAERAFDSRAR